MIKPILRGRDIERYTYKWADLWLIVIPFGWTNKNVTVKDSEEAEEFLKTNYSAIYNHLILFKDKAKARFNKGNYWWELQASTYYSEYEKEKIGWATVSSKYKFSIVPKGFYSISSIYFITNINLNYACPVLNSQAVRKYLSFLLSSEDRYSPVTTQAIRQIPIPLIKQENESIVHQLEHLTTQIIDAKNQNLDVTLFMQEVDTLVYKLYDLNDEEIKVIEHKI
ncbi:MAG: TaqI-like C-terminal specificity domain-containing protein [Candidatus Micrarchaeaceae archaeon]